MMLVGAMKTYTGRRRAPGGVFINTGGNRRCEGVFVLAALLPPPVAAATAALVCTSFAPAQLSLSLSLALMANNKQITAHQCVQLLSTLSRP